MFFFFFLKDTLGGNVIYAYPPTIDAEKMKKRKVSLEYSDKNHSKLTYLQNFKFYIPSFFLIPNKALSFQESLSCFFLTQPFKSDIYGKLQCQGLKCLNYISKLYICWP